VYRKKSDYMARDNIMYDVLRESWGSSALARLTERELSVLALLARGLSNKEIARDLCITSHTAKAHVSHILFKLGVESRTEAAVLWARHGLGIRD
jgi:two-component system nitrate/nitrite response regulator NarL